MPKEAKSKTIKKSAAKKSPWQVFSTTNLIFFAVGLLILVVGYIAMLQGPHDSFWSLHFAPIILVVAYCVVIPWAILKRGKQTKSEPTA